jgi:GNAT superfamily N-acetyltransferase
VTVAVRRGAASDLDALVGIHVRSSSVAYAHIFPPDAPFPSDEDIAARWRPAFDRNGAAAVFVAELDGAIIGGAIADRAPAQRGFGNLRHLYVDPLRWGSGAGQALHDAVVDWCRDGGVDELELWVLQENERARSMYERWGWQIDPDETLVHPGLDVTELRYVMAPAPSS